MALTDFDLLYLYIGIYKQLKIFLKIRGKKMLFQIFSYIKTLNSLYKRGPNKFLLLINIDPKIKNKSKELNSLKS